ncbi:hypothetical protein [Leptospira stimsonii]|uniref:Uncharacterized protein n=1 Tax=Leptospira stimsonii TaxID=2202203 RepID=A0A396Z7Y5_9LEPT|nr:hypothetical protein [Leptospira stimsonii]RHX90755.1 hypothetical protein DLM75_10235 [Leptospira stimsonii]
MIVLCSFNKDTEGIARGKDGFEVGKATFGTNDWNFGVNKSGIFRLRFVSRKDSNGTPRGKQIGTSSHFSEDNRV